MSKFITGVRAPSADFATISTMPDSQKEQLCLDLLNEFGARIVSVSAKGEICHSCPLPFGGHKNGDQNPSAFLNYKKLVFKCWSCGSEGGLLWFIATCRGQTSEQAKDWMRSQTGIGGEQTLGALLDYFDAVWSPQKEYQSVTPKFNPSILDPWKLIHPYLTEIRQIPVENVMHFNVGYNPSQRVFIGNNKWVESERIIIPHFWRGDLTGWQSRRLTKDGTPKYLCSPEMPRDRSLYNYDPKEPVVVVESPMSVIKQWPYHLEATFGGMVTDTQIRLIADHPRVTLFFDNDEAGYIATHNVAAALSRYGDVLVVENPYNADPADLDPETCLHLIETAVPYSVWSAPERLLNWPPSSSL